MRKLLLLLAALLLCLGSYAQKWRWNGQITEIAPISESNYPKAQSGQFFAIFQITRVDGKPMPNTTYTLTGRATSKWENGKLLVQVPTMELASRNKFAITCEELGAIAFDYQVSKVKKRAIYSLQITNIMTRSIKVSDTVEDTSAVNYDSEKQFQQLLNDPNIKNALGN